MAHHKSALKRIRQDKKRKSYNRFNKKQMREALKAVRTATTHEAGQDALRIATRILDKVAARGIIHKNNAANKKSSLAKLINKLKTA
ncbi:MAG TPA: 30S ribosomal protein S20 [Patescibacteria group bacterium]|nr:30S ribosomal protein S20 [Patescibacteria group bacterium]